LLKALLEFQNIVHIYQPRVVGDVSMSDLRTAELTAATTLTTPLIRALATLCRLPALAGCLAPAFAVL
jgi:hypothetical protein